MLRPASQAGPGRKASASRRLRWVQPAHRASHRPAARGAAALPTESCDSDAPSSGPCRPVPEARGRPDPERVTRMTWTRTVAALDGPGSARGRPARSE